jgi:nicotinate-nucleotide adenylyltransferase
VVGRGGVPTVLPEAPWKATFVEIPALELSSTGLRERAAAGAPLDGLVPQGAMHWIRQRGLYARERNA